MHCLVDRLRHGMHNTRAHTRGHGSWGNKLVDTPALATRHCIAAAGPSIVHAVCRAAKRMGVPAAGAAGERRRRPADGPVLRHVLPEEAG